MEQLHLHKEQFNRLFPFHLLIGSDLIIVSAGKTLQKLIPQCKGKHLLDVFQIKRPGLDHIHFEILKKIHELVILQSLQKENIVLRGQIEWLDQNNELLFIGTPWFSSMEQLKEENLRLNDFSIADPMIDLLHVLKTQEIANNEVRELLDHTQKQSNELVASSKRLAQLITNLQTGVLLEDEHRKIVLVNQIFCNLFSIPVDPNQMIGWDCSDSAQQSKQMFKDPESFVHKIDAILAKKEKVIGEVLELADGRVFERDYIPMFVDNIYKGHLWNYTDITERSHQQELLRKSEEKYRGIISNINLGLVEVDLEEKIQYVNQSFCHISGYTKAELIGKKPSEILLPDRGYELMMEEKNSLRTDGISDVYEIPVTIKDGHKKWWLISGAPLYNDTGAVIGSIGIHLDITRQKNLEQQLREAKIMAERSAEAKEIFLANMSHEIRTPLSGIYGMMQLLEGTRLNVEQKNYIQFIDKAIENLQTVINDILDFSKINAGMIDIDENDFSLKEEVEATYQLILPKARQKGLELEFHYDAHLAKFYSGDAHRIGQVITNLMGNAIKFTEKGSVTIGCRLLRSEKNKDWVEIRVSDTGVGIDAAYLPQLFEKFTQEENGRSKKYGGTGLGMSISKQLVELMHGTIDVESQKGSGTHVIVILPLTPRLSRTVTKNTNELVSGTLQGLRILVAEDNDINATVINSLLTREGAEVTLVVNGQELIDQAKLHRFDLIISDLQMPIMGGMEAVAWVREHLPAEQRMIALTANAFEEEKERCLQAGFNDIVYKPFKKEALIKICAGQKLDETNKESKAAHKEEKLYNLDNLADMVDHNEKQIRYLVQQFLEETPEKIDLLRHSLAEGNLSQIRKTAHYLSSSIHHLDIASLFELTTKIEHAKETRINTAMTANVNTLCEGLDKVIIQLKRDFPIDQD